MKFKVSSSEFLKRLNMASGVLGTKNVLAILEDFLFVLNGDKLTIYSSNLETTVISSIDVQGEEDGEIAVPAKILSDTLKALPDQPVSLETDEKDKLITVTSSYGKYKLSLDNADDYPTLPAKEDVTTFRLSSRLIVKMLERTLFATSNDELRLQMQGVFMQIEEKKIIFAATDAHKLVKYSFKHQGGVEGDSIIIPKRGLNQLKNILSDNMEVEVSYNLKNVFFTLPETQVIIRLIDQKFPDYNGVIPTNNTNILAMDRQEFLSSLKRIAIYSNKSTNQVVLNISDGSLTVSAQDLDFSNEATEQLNCEYNSDPMNIGFNAKFLIEMLSVLDYEKVNLKLSTPSKAGILVPGDPEDGEELLMLVMPVMLGN